MAISKDESSMLNPTSDGNNYGYNGRGPMPTNYNEVAASCQRTSGIDKALSSVTTSGASGQDFVNKLVSGGGMRLGKPLGSDGMSN